MSSLTSGIDILQCFASERPELRVSDVARRLNMPKSTVTRLLKEMLRHGLVEQDRKTRTYRPGPLAFRLGTLYQAHLQILDLVETAVEELVAEFGLTGYIGVLDGTDVVILRVRQGSYPVRFVLEPGYRVPAFTTAIGKALLARMDDATVTEMHPPELHYETTHLDMPIAQLLRELRAARTQGWSEAAERTFTGFGAVGTAVGAADGQQPLGFCLSYPTNTRFDNEKERMVARLISQADRIGRRAGDPHWAGRPATSVNVCRPDLPGEVTASEQREPLA